ncbi:hypothetical protein [Terrisporobacter glycolicus]|uniref:Uncharacterized protein n=1 Tax=Terrisporobacter glycolicus ATCC 14880 = DSM 1288 TaxID=1121315 RepID=A0ABZ2EX42_9FIRM|nr:hypothetical protein [Terrisporobacter glycolicus]
MDKIQSFLVQFGSECLETISMVCYDWLVVVGLIALVLYVFGWEKGKSIGFMMPAVYIIIQILSKVICRV